MFLADPYGMGLMLAFLLLAGLSTIGLAATYLMALTHPAMFRSPALYLKLAGLLQAWAVVFWAIRPPDGWRPILDWILLGSFVLTLAAVVGVGYSAKALYSASRN